MSFDLFIGCFQNGKAASFPRALVDDAFAPYISAKEPGCLTVDFGVLGQSYVFRADLPNIESFNLNRPVAAPALYVALYAILKGARVALYMPGECPPLVGRAEMANHLPEGMIEALGHPVQLQSPSEIEEWIRRA